MPAWTGASASLMSQLCTAEDRAPVPDRSTDQVSCRICCGRMGMADEFAIGDSETAGSSHVSRPTVARWPGSRVCSGGIVGMRLSRRDKIALACC